MRNKCILSKTFVQAGDESGHAVVVAPLVVLGRRREVPLRAARVTMGIARMADDQVLVRVAWLYYMEGLTQDRIASQLRLTRLRVNRTARRGTPQWPRQHHHQRQPDALPRIGGCAPPTSRLAGRRDRADAGRRRPHPCLAWARHRRLLVATSGRAPRARAWRWLGSDAARDDSTCAACPVPRTRRELDDGRSYPRPGDQHVRDCERTCGSSRCAVYLPRSTGIRHQRRVARHHCLPAGVSGGFRAHCQERSRRPQRGRSQPTITAHTVWPASRCHRGKSAPGGGRRGHHGAIPRRQGRDSWITR